MILKPTISIVMYCYNDGRYVANALENLSNQSNVSFELIIIEDGSSDETLTEVQRLGDSRMHLVRNIIHHGKYSAYNTGLKLAKGKYVCFMDSHDIFLPNRLKIQMDYMESHPKVGCLGVRAELINHNGDAVSVSQQPSDYRQLKVALLKSNTLINSSLIFRKSLLKKYELTYQVHLGEAADYDFIVRASQNFSIRNIDSILIQRMINTKQVSEKELQDLNTQSDIVRLDQLKQLNIEADKQELDLHLKLMRGDSLAVDEFEDGVNWLNRILDENKKIRHYDSSYLHQLFENILTNEASKIAYQKNANTFFRTDLLNLLIQKFDYNSYLEIGVNRPNLNFDHIKCKNKIGVDPVPLRADIVGITSDQYFDQLDKHEKFDLIFIDGLHHHEQVIRDIENALNHLTETGTIVCHDMLPENEQMQLVPRETALWTGDCWKAWAHFRMRNNDLHMTVVNTDFGLGIIRRGDQQVFNPSQKVSELDYSFFSDHKQELMKLINVNDFLELLDFYSHYQTR